MRKGKEEEEENFGYACVLETSINSFFAESY